MELFIRGQLIHVEGIKELLTILDGIMDPERNIELGKLAYNVYCTRLTEHQPTEAITWDRLPPYMHDTWVMVAEVIEIYVKDRDHHK